MVQVHKEREDEFEKTLTSVGLGGDSLDSVTQETLNELVEIAMELGVDPVNSKLLDIAKALSDQIDREDDLKLRLHAMRSLQSSLEEDLVGMKALKNRLEQAQQIQEARQDTVDEKFSEWTRGIKLLQAKTEEYRSRTKAINVPILYTFIMLGHS